MGLKIGEIKQINEEWYQCVEGRCKDCYFSKERYLCKQFITKNFCTSGIIFKKLEKVGEPFERNGYRYQEYKAHTYPLLMSGGAKIPTYNGFAVIIKQNKEDMEEKNNGNTPLNVLTDKYVNGDICYDDFEKEVKALYSCKEEIKPTLKEFDLEAAKLGKPVCTRDGRKARILSFTLINKNFPIVAIVDCRGEENVYQFETNGVCDEHDDNLDFMMLPEKKEGWVNVYKKSIYKTKEEAFNRRDKENYLMTIKVDWEE